MLISEEILSHCKANNRRGQEALYKMCYPDLLRVLYRYVRIESDAEDVLNRGMLKVFTRIDQFQGNSENFFAWIKRIIINEALDHLRSKRTIHSENPDNLTIPDPVRVTDENDAKEQIRFLLEQIPELSSTIFNMHVMEGYSHAEIAELLEISVSNSKWHVFSARKQLQKLLSQTSFL